MLFWIMFSKAQQHNLTIQQMTKLSSPSLGRMLNKNDYFLQIYKILFICAHFLIVNAYVGELNMGKTNLPGNEMIW